jgi:uroporphyrinogen III methyltransferase/synthase
MGIGTLGIIVERLITNGRSAQTPAALVADATLPTQRLVKAPLGDIEQTCRREAIEPPALIIVGEAAEGDDGLNWFMNQPLFGKTIVTTRDAKGNAEFASKIIARGGRPVSFATLAIKPLTSRTQFVTTLAGLTDYDWAVFTSPNGVDIFFDVLSRLGKDARVFASTKVAALGAKTAAALRSYGIVADFVPGVFTGRDLALGLLAAANLHDKKIVLLRSELASDELPKLLRQGKAQVDDVAIYTAVTQVCDASELTRQIRRGQIDCLTFASPSAAGAFCELIAPDVIQSSRVKVASIGPVTSARIIELGLHVDVEATEHTTEGMLDAIESAEKNG